ncbi:MAG: helix-turn-helix transcriptional regulator [Alphaproteobacteria bacterium]|nr:helix-turn-helix transcriptional regulator [Alphaproteobacteria bacterium]
MEPCDAVELVLKKLACSQKELALRLGVSPTQITKWKNGEYMSNDMETRIRELTGIGDIDPSVVLAAGTLEDARKWQALISRMAEMVIEDSDTGTSSETLTDPDGMLLWETFYTLKEMGVVIPQPFPKELEAQHEEEDGDEEEEENDPKTERDSWQHNPCSLLIYRLLQSYSDILEFFHVCGIAEICFDEDVSDAAQRTGFENIPFTLMSLAATKIEVDEKQAPGFSNFAATTKTEFRQWLKELKLAAIRAGIPLRAEVMDLLHCSHPELALKADADWCGFNDLRLHPDIYMNELLVGMRMIHQVLPAIMEKLDILDTFELDDRELCLHSRRSRGEKGPPPGSAESP